MKGRILADWTKVNMADPQSRAKVFGALNHFARIPTANPEVKAAFQQFAQSGDFPASVLQVLEKFRITPMYDEGWRLIFDERDYTGSDRSGFKLLDVQCGLTFNEVPIGGKAKLFKMAGSEVSVSFALYAGGLHWHRTLFDDREYWTLEDNAHYFRNQAYLAKAQAHYDLIDAVPSSQNLAWQAPVPAALAATDPNYVAIRDIETINAACTGILTDLKDKGLGITPNSQFVLLAPVQLKARVLRAIGLLNQGLAGDQRGLVFNVQPVFSMMLESTSKYYVAYPKAKSKSGNRMDLTIFDKFDAESYTDIAVGWMRYGAAIGDIQQFRRCATS